MPVNVDFVFYVSVWGKKRTDNIGIVLANL